MPHESTKDATLTGLSGHKFTPRFFLYSLLALILEFPFFFSYFVYDNAYINPHTAAMLAIHFFAALAMFFSTPRGRGWFHYHRNWAQLFFVLTLFMPLFGVLLSIFLFLGYKQNNDPEALFSEDITFFQMDKLLQRPVSADSSETKTLKAIEIVPLADILSSDDIDLKRGAIEKLALIASPEAIKMLIAHSSDPAPEVRFFINASLTRIKKSFDEQLDAAKIEMKGDVYKISARIFLAKTYIRYARSNLLDASSVQNCLSEAVHHLNFSINADFANKDAYRMLIDIHERASNWEKVFETALMMENKSVVSLGEIIKIKLKYFYHTRQYKVFYKELANLVKLKDEDPEWLAMANWWGISQ
ncbi:MAG: HEAT repeat domain-containing protein [Deltaproteobacteria bacterium]|nr:HEAT repeat domain-containing protein [Deltaproteobacteria bacterium]